MTEKLRKTVLKYLQEHYTMTVAAVTANTPWAASLFYASDGFTLYFLSDPESRHSRYISENPAVAVTVTEDYHDWQKIRGIQMAAKAEVITAQDELERAIAIYVDKYPFTATYLKVMASPLSKAAGYLDKILSKLPFTPGLPATFNARFYRVTATEVRFVDNEKGFAHHEEFVP
ncbi:pyridoxamine 5'-phosphate oxidase family protein [Chloroflexota bacterium]